jgi:hypothetical protein
VGKKEAIKFQFPLYLLLLLGEMKSVRKTALSEAADIAGIL